MSAKPRVAAILKKAGVGDLPNYIYLRAFKREQVLEVWGASSSAEEMTLVVAYPIAKMSGKLGPKRKEGDRQVPEGIYSIDRFNPKSQFHLSLGLNYPNASDRARSDKEHPGGDIFIHGNRASIGCLAMTDPVIEEIWSFATFARDSGQRDIPVHIFPARLDKKTLEQLIGQDADQEKHKLWKELEPFYTNFEAFHRVPRHTVDSNGAYALVKDL